MSTDRTSSSSIDVRLRELQASRGWTLVEMSSLSGISKNSLQNYMRKVDPQKPGTDALAAMALGFGVSADWLLGIDDSPALSSAVLTDAQRLMVERAFRMQFLQFIRSVNRDWDLYGAELFANGRYQNNEPEALVDDFAESYMRIVDELAEYGDLVAPLYLLRGPRRAEN